MLIFGAVELSQPSLNELPSDLLGAARQVAESLSQRGHRSWIVGGAVRDLCMGRTPADVDLTTDATPDEVEACFPMTVPLGRRFGTVLVKVGELELLVKEIMVVMDQIVVEQRVVEAEVVPELQVPRQMVLVVVRGVEVVMVVVRV